MCVTASEDPGAVAVWICGCGIRQIAGSAGELDRLKGKHFDYYTERGGGP